MEWTNCALVRNLCVIHHSWWRSAHGLRIAGISPNLQLLRYRQCGHSSHVNSLSNQFGDFVHCPFSILEVQHHNALLSFLHCDENHGVESRHTWRWESRTMSSPRVSFRNHSPNSVLSKDPFLFCSWTLFSRIVKATVIRCTLEDSSSFQSCSNLVTLTRDTPR